MQIKIQMALFLLFLGCLPSARCELIEPAISLTIEFNGLSTNDGKIMILVKNENQEDYVKLVIPIIAKSSRAIIEVPPGSYAVIAFHDINSNEKLDTNMLGIPTEPYGFSNDARGTFGEPDFEDQLVSVKTNKTISFKLQ